MAGFINWNNMGSITDTSDAIDEREQAYEPVQFDSNSWTNIGIAKQRAITPTAPTAYEQRKSSLEEATERNKAILGDKLAQDAQKRDELLIASGADENQVNQNRQIQTEIKNKDSLERIQNHIASKSDPLNKVSFFDEDLENAIHNLSRNEVIELYAGKPELRDYILSQQGYAANQLAKTGLYSDSAASVFGNAASVGLGAAGEEAALLDWANYTAKSLTGSSESEKTKAITEGLSNKLNNLSDEYRNTAARLSDESTAARQELTDWEYDKKIAQQKINGLRGSEVNQDTVGRELSKVKDVLSDGYQVTKEIAQEVPSTIATLGVAKGITSGTKAVTKALAKDKIKSNLAKEEAKYIAKQKAKTELTEDAIKATPEFAKAQEAAKKNIDAVFTRKSQKHSGKIITGWETVSSGAQNGVPAYSDAASFILNQDDKSFKESKGFKDLQKENPDITVDDAKQVLANKAGEEAMLRAFFSSATLGAAFSNAERKLFDRLFKGKSLATIKERAKSFGISVGSNAAQEFGEEASSKLYSNLAINNALGYKAVDESRDVLSSGLYGAITGGATTTLTNTPELIGSAKKAGINKLKDIRNEVLDNKKTKNTAEAFDGSISSDEIKQDSKSFRESQKEASSIVSQAIAGKELTPEQQTRLDEINTQNAKLDDKYESAITETTKMLKDVISRRQALDDFAESEGSDTEEGFQKFIDMGIDTLKAGGVSDAQLASIESKLSKASLAEKAMHYNNMVNDLEDSLLNKRDAQIAAKDAQFRGIDSTISTESHEKDSVNPTALSSLNLDDVNPEDIKVSGDTVSVKGKDYSKDDVTASLTNHIKKLSFDKEIPLGKEVEHLKSSLNSIKKLEALHKDLEAKGIKSNINFSALFKAMDKVTKGLNTNNISPAEAVTLQEQLFGSKYKGKVNRGLLHYAKEAVLNNGKLSTNSRLALSKFIRSQTGKAAAVQNMLKQMRNDILDGKFNPDGYTFDNEDTKSQLTQSGEHRKFTSVEQAEKYAKAVRRIQNEFLNFATDVATKMFSFNETTEPTQTTKAEEPVAEEPVTSTKENKEDTAENATEETNVKADKPAEETKPAPQDEDKDEDDEVSGTKEATDEPEAQVNTESIEVTPESSSSNEALYNLVDEFHPESNEEIKKDLAKLSEPDLENLLLKVSKEFKAMALPMFSAIVDYATKNKAINFKTLLNNLKNKGTFNENNLKFIETMLKDDLDWVVGNILFNRLVQNIQSLPKDVKLFETVNGRPRVITSEKTKLLNQVADEITSSISSKVNVYATNESLSSIALNKDNQDKLISLIHQNLQTPANKKWISDTTANYAKTDPSMNQEYSYMVNGDKHTMPMWLALEYRNKGISFDQSELKDLGINNIKESVITTHYDDLLNIAEGGDSSELVKSLGLSSDEDIEFIHNTAALLKAVKDHLYKSVPELLKDPSKQSYGLGISGIYNFLQLNTDEDGKTAVVIPKELVQLMTSNVLNGLQTMNNLTSTNTKETEDFLFGQGYSLEVLDTSNGSYQNKKVELDVSSLGSNQNHLVSQIGTKGIQFLGVKSNQQNTALYQAIATSLGVETLNFIQEQGVLKTQQVNQFIPTNSDKKPEPVNSYKFVAVNWGKLENNPLLRDMVKFANTELVNKVLGVNTVSNDYQIVGLKDNIGTLTAENKHVATEFTSGNNQEVKDALNVYNNQEWALDTEFLDLQDKLGNIYDLATDGFDENEEMTEKARASATSKAQQLYRAKEKLQAIIEQGKALGAKALKDIRFKGLYELMTNSRVNMKSSVNPQNIKFHRESMNLVQRDKDGNEIEYSFTKPDLQGNSLGQFSRTADDNVKMFSLSLAQALGVKIEKKSLNEIFSELDSVLALPVNQDMLNLITSSSVKDDAATRKIAKAFQKEYGNGGHRAIKALMTYNNFMNTDSNKPFVSNLFLEADGIGNGMHNIVMQFNTSLSGDMLKSLLKTGVITTDRIAEAYQKAIEQDPSVSLETVINNLEGSAEIFSKELSSDIPKDVYEDVSNVMANSIQDAFITINNGLAILNQYIPHNIDSIPQFIQEDGKARIDHAIEMIEDKLGDANEETRSYLLDSIKALESVLDSINLISILDLSGSLKDANTKESLLGLSISDASAVATGEYVNEIVAEISRAFAKAGVTPATYGGKLNGIAQQLIKNVMSDLTSLANKLYTGSNDIASFTRNWNKFITLAYSTNALPTEFTLYFPNDKEMKFDLTGLLKSEESMSKFLNTVPDIKEMINDMLNMSFDNKYRVEYSLKSGVASLLNSAVQQIYGEALNIASQFLAFTDPMFEVFHDEFLKKVDDKISERNLAKGWAVYKNGKATVVNPKGYDGLTKKEYKDILKTMENLPVVATAFSQNNSLLDSLVHTGMSNIKTANTQQLGQTSISSIYKNRQTVEFLSATISTQIKEYQQAGASTFTNTVVSVESKAQADAQKRANKEGKAFLNVFDGGDALAAIAQAIGQYLNEASYAGHQSYSVMEALWNMYNNSDLWKVAKFMNNSYNLQNHLIKSGNKIYLDKQSVNALKLFQAIKQSGLELKGLDKTVDIVSRVLRMPLDSQIQGVEVLSIDIDDLNKAITSIRVRGLDKLFTAAMDKKASEVASHRATMSVLKQLPIKYNQFAGSSRGVTLNTESALANIIIKDLIDNQISSTDTLANYIKSNEELSKIYKDEYLKQYATLHLNKDASYSVNITSLSKVMADLEKAKGNSTQDTTYKALVNIIKPLVANMEIPLLSQEEILESHPELSEQLAQSKAMYIPNKGLYLPKGITNVEALHELLHFVLADSFSKYASGKADSKTKAAIGEIISIAKALNTKLSNKDTINLFNELSNTTSPNLKQSYLKVSKIQASVTNLLFAFDEDATKHLSQEQKENLKYEALQEFTAYSFTEADSIALLVKTTTNRGFKKILNTLLDFFKQIHSNISKMFGVKPSDDFARSSLVEGLTYIQALASNKSGTNEQALSSYKDLANMTAMIQGSNNSSEFKNFLNDLTTTIKQSVKELTTVSTSQLGDILDYPQQLAMYTDDDIDAEAKNYLAGLRSTGIKVTDGEEVAFVLMNKLLKINRSLGNVSGLEQGNNLMQAVIEKISPTRFMGQSRKAKDRFSAVFTKDTDHGLALLLTNETFRKEMLKHTAKGVSLKGNAVHKWLKGTSESEKLLDLFAQYKDPASINSLAHSLAQIDVRNALKNAASIDRRIEEQKANDRDVETLNKIYEVFGKGSKISDVIGAVASVGLSGKDRLTYNEKGKPEDESTFVGKLIDLFLGYDVSNKGRTTAISTFMSWLLGEREDTHRIHALHNEHLINLDKVRERVGGVTKKGLSEFFKNKPSDEQNKLIHKMFRTNLHGYFAHSSSSSHDFALLNDSQFINDKLNDYSNEIKQLINTDVTATPKVKDQIYNYLMWQSNGLADLQRDNEAKSMESQHTHNIMPNSRMISSLKQLNGVLKFTLTDGFSDKLNDVISARTALVSFNGLPKEDQDAIVNYAKEEKAALHKLMLNSQRIHSEAQRNLLGRDGYVVGKKDPHYDLQIVKENDTESYMRLKKLGYVKKAKLANGEIVMSTDGALSNRYKTGMFALTEFSSDGVNTNDYSIQGVTSTELGKKHSANLVAAADKQLVRALNDPDYYNKLTATSNYQPVINEQGEVVRYEASVPYEIADNLVPSREQGYESLANMSGRLVEEMVASRENKRYVDILADIYNTAKNKQEFIQITSDFKIKGNTNLDKQFENKIRTIYNTLPQETKNYIDEKGGLYIPIKEVNNILGYHETWLSDVFTGKSYFPEPVQVAIRGAANVFGGIAGIAPAKAIRVMEEYLKETTSLSKDYILNRSLIVPLGNLLSNVLHLVQWGINPVEIPKLMKEGYTNAIQYQKYMNELDKINFLLKQGGLSSAAKLKYEAKQNQLNNLIKNSPVHSLVQGGILTSITALEVGDDQDEDISRLGKLESKLGLNTVYNNTPEIVKSVLLKKDSKAHDFFVKTLDYGDFVAKYALYKHLLRKGKSEYHAMNVIREEFINYSANRGAFFDWMNATGLTWFLNYKLGIQKVIFRSFRRNFLRTAAIMSSDSFVSKAGLDPLGIYQTVPSQYLEIGNVLPFGSYQTSNHLIDGFESHYIARLIELLN